ncbi:hypothetical protein EON73_00670 [bacterium]|nr:MAG: hypothetical protein EON73_00670 [bacterium]
MPKSRYTTVTACLQKLKQSGASFLLFKTKGCPKPKVIQNLRGTKGYQSKPLDRKTSRRRRQNYVLQAGGGKTLFCKPYKALLCMAAKLRANLWFASRRRQNVVLQAIQSFALYGVCTESKDLQLCFASM